MTVHSSIFENSSPFLASDCRAFKVQTKNHINHKFSMQAFHTSNSSNSQNISKLINLQPEAYLKAYKPYF